MRIDVARAGRKLRNHLQTPRLVEARFEQLPPVVPQIKRRFVLKLVAPAGGFLAVQSFLRDFRARTGPNDAEVERDRFHCERRSEAFAAADQACARVEPPGVWTIIFNYG